MANTQRVEKSEDQPVLVLMEGKDGIVEQKAIVPMSEVEDSFGAKKQGIISRVGARVSSWFRPRTSMADDEGTTELGVVGGQALGDGYFTNTMSDAIKEETTRRAKYTDYMKIDNECTELSRALSVTVQNVFTSSKGDEDSYEIKSKDARVEKIIADLDQRVDMQSELPEICKSMLHIGDDFEELVVDKNMSIVRIKWLNQKYMFRVEDEYGRLDGEGAFAMKDDDGRVMAKFKPWQCVHLRHDHQRGNLYGRSFFFNSRHPWRLLVGMEDAVAMNRFVRAGKRLVYKIAIKKNATEEEVRRIIVQAKKDLKRKSLVDPNTGKIDIRKSPLGDDEDIFMAVYEGSPADVVPIEGSAITGNLADVEYFQNKLFMSTGVPKSYLGLERDVNAKATLTWQDIEYARILRAIQKEMAWFQRRVYDLQLVLVGVVPDKELYDIVYPPISFVDEEMKMAVERTKWEILALAKGVGIPINWLLKSIVGLAEEEVAEIMTNFKEPGGGDVQIPGQGSVSADSPGGQAAIAKTRGEVFKNQKMVASMHELRDMVRVIYSERLNKAVAF